MISRKGTSTTQPVKKDGQYTARPSLPVVPQPSPLPQPLRLRLLPTLRALLPLPWMPTNNVLGERCRRSLPTRFLIFKRITTVNDDMCKENKDVGRCS